MIQTVDDSFSPLRLLPHGSTGYAMGPLHDSIGLLSLRKETRPTNMQEQGWENATVGTPRLESEEPRAMPNVNSYYQIGDSWEGCCDLQHLSLTFAVQ